MRTLKQIEAAEARAEASGDLEAWIKARKERIAAERTPIEDAFARVFEDYALANSSDVDGSWS